MATPQRFPSQTKWLIVLVLLALGLAITMPLVAQLYVDLAWFEALGFDEVYTRRIAAQLVLAVAGFTLIAGTVWINAKLAFRYSGGYRTIRVIDAQGRTTVDFGRVRPTFVLPTAVALGTVAGLAGLGAWPTWIRFWHRTPFGEVDPLFGRDIGFYVFTLPVLEDVRGVLFWMVALGMMFAIGIYVMRGALHVEGTEISIGPNPRLHISVLAAALFLVLGFDAWLGTIQLLYSSHGPVAGASYTDVHATLLGLRLKIGLAGVGALLCLVYGRRNDIRLPLLAVAVYALAHVLGTQLYPSIVQRFRVEPNEAVKEDTLIGHNITATRRAYGLDNVRERELSASSTLTRADIEANRATVDNIRLWDHGLLLETFAQIQEIRPYYDFKSVDNDRYMIDGRLRQTMLSPRELASSSLTSRTWINERFTFTHGYGLTLGPVNEKVGDGLPKLYVQDIPPHSSVESLAVTRPAIYYGELSNDYVFVHTDAEEFDHPSGNDNIYASYTGNAGLKLESLWSRLMLSTYLRTLKVLLSDDLNAQSRVLLHRNIRDRIARLAPFLMLDRDPYMVVRDNGELVWIQDAYTITHRYPYAQPINTNINYIRNSVKVVMDAFNGDVSFYVNDTTDPIIEAWRKAFPSLFVAVETLPADLHAHLRHPEDLFTIQTELFTIYHMRSAQLVYNREDQWEIPGIRDGQELRPYYTIMRLPEEREAEFILMLPFTPKRKQNLSAWMVARNDGETRGQLIVYRFPKDRLVFGPRQIMNRINQDEIISEQRTLWDQQGSSARFGQLLVIPIEESLIYVVPLYLLSGNKPIPQLKRVIVVYGNTIAMRETLDEAIAVVFGGQVKQPTRSASTPTAAAAPNAPVQTDLAAQAKALFDRAIQAQRNGNWAMYGEAIEELGRVLDKLKANSTR